MQCCGSGWFLKYLDPKFRWVFKYLGRMVFRNIWIWMSFFKYLDPDDFLNIWISMIFWNICTVSHNLDLQFTFPDSDPNHCWRVTFVPFLNHYFKILYPDCVFWMVIFFIYWIRTTKKIGALTFFYFFLFPIDNNTFFTITILRSC